MHSASHVISHARRNVPAVRQFLDTSKVLAIYVHDLLPPSPPSPEYKKKNLIFFRTVANPSIHPSIPSLVRTTYIQLIQETYNWSFSFPFPFLSEKAEKFNRQVNTTCACTYLLCNNWLIDSKIRSLWMRFERYIFINPDYNARGGKYVRRNEMYSIKHSLT